MKRIKQLADELLTLFLIITFGTFMVLTVTSKKSKLPKSHDKYAPSSVYVHKTLSPYVSEYINTLEAAGIKLPYGEDLVLIDMSYSLPNNILGIAFGMEIDNITLVNINGNTWDALSNNQKRLLIFHELSHDIFNLYHFDTLVMGTPMPGSVPDIYFELCVSKLIEHLKSL